MEGKDINHPYGVSWKDSILGVMATGGYSLSRFASPAEGGLVWQNWAYRLLTSSRARQVQGPGSVHLFGYPAASGLRHEIDAAGIGDVPVIIEAKDRVGGLNKTSIDCLCSRSEDFVDGAGRHGWLHPLYRMIWSARAIDGETARYGASKGIIMVAPNRVPLPSLLAAAEDWHATEWATDEYLNEFVTLAERACRPVRIVQIGSSSFHPIAWWRRRDLDDLEHLHDLLSEQWLDWIDLMTPLLYERYAETCLCSISGWSELIHLRE